MKRKLSFVAALWWEILLAILGLFLVLLAGKQPRPSETENRMLAGFPEVSAQSVVSGDFMSGFESYLSDGFIGRQGVIDFSERLLGRFSTLKGDELFAARAADMEQRLAEEGAMQAQADAPQADAGAVETADAPEESAAAALIEADDDAEEDIDAGAQFSDEALPVTAENSYLWLKRVDGGRKILYKYDNAQIQSYSETLRRIRALLPSDGVVCFTQVPLAQIANRWTDQRETYCGWGSTVELVLEKCLEGTQGIYVFNTMEILEPHMEGDVPMFYHTDHHWTAEGAYLVLEEMLKAQHLPVIPYDEYTYKSMKGKVNGDGRSDTFNALYPLLPGHSYVVTHRTDATEIHLMNYGHASYTTFMNNSRQPWRRVVTGANTGRKALVICDSFGNALTPYLLPYYDEVHMCDFRVNYYDKAAAGGSIGENIAYHGIDDVYIITSTANGLRKDNSLKYLPMYLAG